MSSYMLVLNQATIKSRTMKQTSDMSSRSGKSSGSSISINSYATGSVGTSGKKIFDPATMRYVARDTIINLDTRIQKYETEFKALANQNKYHSINERMNRHYYNSSKALFTRENVEILRYTYFEGIVDDINQIKMEVRKTTSNGDYFLNYMNKLRKAGGKYNKSNSLLSKGNSISQSFRLNESKTINSFGEATVGSQFRSKQFWNNVYQDIRSISQNENKVNYFDLLPPINHCLDFFSEYFDFALYNLLLLEGDSSELNEADRKKLNSYTFFYYEDDHLEHFRSFKEYLLEDYERQRDLSEIFNNSRKSYFNKQNKYSDDGYMELNRILIEVIVENLKASLHSSPSNSKEELFSVWSGFLKYHLVELILKESYEPQFVMSDIATDDSTSDFNNYVISRTSSTIMKNRNFAQSSSSSKVSDNSSDCPASPQSPLSDSNMSSFQSKWGVITGIPPIEPFYEDNNLSTTRKSKKKSIFSKFKRNPKGN